MRRQVASTKKARLNASAKMVTKATESQTAVSTYYLWWLRGRTGDGEGASVTTLQRQLYAVFCESFIGNIFFSFLNELQVHHDCKA